MVGAVTRGRGRARSVARGSLVLGGIGRLGLPRASASLLRQRRASSVESPTMPRLEALLVGRGRSIRNHVVYMRGSKMSECVCCEVEVRIRENTIRMYTTDCSSCSHCTPVLTIIYHYTEVY